MTVIRKPATPFRRLSGGNLVTVVSPAAMNPVVPEGNNDIENSSRASAGVEGKPVTGFTCAQCRSWYPQGTEHACARATAAMQKAEAAHKSAGMTAEETRLLQEAQAL